MSESTLLNKIRAVAEATAAEHAAAADAVVAQIEAETDAQIATLTAEATLQQQKRLKQQELVALSQAKQTARLATQKAKRVAIEAIFNTAVKDIEGLDHDGYVQFFAAIAQAELSGITTASTVISPNARLSETNTICQKLGLTAASVVADESLTAGLIVETTDGTYDVSLSRLVRERQPEIEMKVLRALNQE